MTHWRIQLGRADVRDDTTLAMVLSFYLIPTFSVKVGQSRKKIVFVTIQPLVEIKASQVVLMLVKRVQRWSNNKTLIQRLLESQQTQDVEPILIYCWANVAHGGPILNQNWFNLLCLLGRHLPRRQTVDDLMPNLWNFPNLLKTLPKFPPNVLLVHKSVSVFAKLSLESLEVHMFKITATIR